MTIFPGIVFALLLLYFWLATKGAFRIVEITLFPEPRKIFEAFVISYVTHGILFSCLIGLAWLVTKVV